MRLLLVEDEDDLVEALVRGLKTQGYAIDVAEDGEQGWTLATINEYDLIILDLNLPGIDGLEVCRRIRKEHPHCLILMLTARGHPTERVIGLDTGADDYLVKPFYFAELLARIRALLRRDTNTLSRTAFLDYKDLKLDLATRVAWKGNRRLDLTAKEFSMLEYLLYHQGEIISQEKLLEHVWDMHTNPLTNTVRVHMNSLRRKLEGRTEHGEESPSYIETIIGQGYRLGIPQQPEDIS